MAGNPYTREFYPKPRNDNDGKWLYFECSKCGKMIDAQPDNPELLVKLFIQHVTSDHAKEIKPREDFSQATGRIEMLKSGNKQ
jgi:hypothetical protein